VTTNALRAALQNLGKCSKRAAALAPTPLTTHYAELQVGLGTAGDWIAWASRLRSLDFATARKRRSARADSLLESTRFTYVWTAANALFSRDQVLSYLHKGSPPKGELERFRVLHQKSGLSPSDEANALKILHTTLSLARHPDEFPWASVPALRLIDVIYYKYTPDTYKALGAASKAIQKVVVGGNPVNSLDLTALIYSTRNWTFHGSLLNSSFRGAPQQYQLYITTITKALTAIIAGFANALEQAM
jgi:hypothetical protein